MKDLGASPPHWPRPSLSPGQPGTGGLETQSGCGHGHGHGHGHTCYRAVCVPVMTEAVQGLPSHPALPVVGHIHHVPGITVHDIPGVTLYSVP